MFLRSLTILLAFALAAPLSLQAAPAPWYKYQHKRFGTYICTQVDPGRDWERMWGPYRNASCRNG